VLAKFLGCQISVFADSAASTLMQHQLPPLDANKIQKNKFFQFLSRIWLDRIDRIWHNVDPQAASEVPIQNIQLSTSVLAL
jgi:hypothetical protein